MEYYKFCLQASVQDNLDNYFLAVVWDFLEALGHNQRIDPLKKEDIKQLVESAAVFPKIIESASGEFPGHSGRLITILNTDEVAEKFPLLEGIWNSEKIYHGRFRSKFPRTKHIIDWKR